MIFSTKKAFDKSIRYSQTNNIIERVFADLKESNDLSFWLESCNVASSCCGVEAVGGTWRNQLPIDRDGQRFFGQDDLMFGYLFSPSGQTKAPIVEAGTLENEILENLSFAVNELSYTTAKSIHCTSSEAVVKGAIDALKEKKSVVLSYLTDYGSGHYVTLVSYDSDADIFRVYDPWEGNKHCRNRGILEEYESKFFLDRARPRFMEIAA